MILTPIEPHALAMALDRFAAHLAPAARAVFRRIAVPHHAERAAGTDAQTHQDIAIELAQSLGMGILPGSPLLDFGWNGRALRRDSEAYVLLHEIAHYQLAPPERRRAIDFGLGAGPETGDRDAAEAATTVFGIAREIEEARASLLGILWEVEFGQPAFASFLDQNWLEGAERPEAAAHFAAVLAELQRLGLVDNDGRPRRVIADA